jgi:branched-chain amino acid transport system substrate-binding protein
MRILLVALALLIITGCGVSGEVVKTEDLLTIGAILPLTGPASFVGQEHLKGMELAVDSGIEIIYEDSAANPKNAINQFTTLVTFQNIDAAIAILTPVAEVVSPLAQQHEIPLLLTTVSLDSVEDNRDFVFRDFTNSKQDAGLSARFAREHLNATTAIILYIFDDYGQSYSDAFTAEFGGAVKTFGFERSEADFRSQLLKAKALESDVLYVIGYDNHIVNVVRQAKELEINTTFMSNWVLASPLILENAKGAVDDVYITTPDFYVDTREEVVEFKEGFFSKYGHYPDAYAALGYDAVKMLEFAHKSGDIKAGLQEISGYRSLMGEMSVDQDGEMSFPLRFAKVVDGSVIRLS